MRAGRPGSQTASSQTATGSETAAKTGSTAIAEASGYVAASEPFGSD